MPPFQKTTLSAFLFLLTSHAQAGETVIAFDIPAQNLPAALKQLASQSHLQMLYDGPTVQGKHSVALKGRYTSQQALQKMLGGTGLQYVYTAQNTVAVKAAPVTKPLPPGGQKTDNSTTTLAPMTVTAEYESDPTDPFNTTYVQQDATSGTKTDTPIMQTPLNVQVITQQVMRDQQVIRLDQALKNVSGVTTTGNGGTNTAVGGTDQGIILRGFESQTYFRDGFRLQQGSTSREMANVESVEILKGSAAILYGLVEPGGMVNIITKKPLATPYYSFNQQFGSYDLYRTSIDATGPVSKNKDLLYRLNLSYENSGSFREFVYNKNIFVAPVLTWNISPQTQATVEMEYSHKNMGLDGGYVPIVPIGAGGASRFLNIPRSRNYGEPSPDSTETLYAGFNWSHAFNDNWKIKHRASANIQSIKQPRFVLGSQNDDINTGRILFSADIDYDTYSTNLDLTGKFDTWGLEHTLLIGGDYYHLSTRSSSALAMTDLENFTSDFSFIDNYNPVHPGTPFTQPLTPSGTSNIPTDQFGFYIQDQIKLPYNFQVMGGIRYQNIHISNFFQNPDFLGGELSSDGQSQDAVTPRVGILYRPQNWLSLYANYVESFGANTGRLFPGKPVPPTSAEQYEGGIKTEFFGGRLRSTLAYYDLTKTNVTMNDPLHPNFVIANGTVRSRGPEVDISGEILPGWSVIATYAYTDTRILESDGSIFPAGSRLPNVPLNKGSLFTAYQLMEGDLKGLRFGGGVNLASGLAGCCAFEGVPAITAPGYATFDIFTGYSLEVGNTKVTAQVNVNNLLDKNYFTSVYAFKDSVQPDGTLANTGFVDFGQPRTVMGSISVQY